MKAMILVAGRGERMRPLTDETPKPLISVASKPLVQYHIEGLARAGVTDIVLNPGWLGDQFIRTFGTGEAFGVNLHYSVETPGRFETGGGIRQALQLLGSEPFIVVNGDIATDFPFDELLHRPFSVEQWADAVLVENPSHNSGGDFSLASTGDLSSPDPNAPTYTFSGISIVNPTAIRDWPETHFSLGDVLRKGTGLGLVKGYYYQGYWSDVGTLGRLKAAEACLAAQL